jgi:ClpP class serine protease
VAASGGYYLLCAGDTMYASEARARPRACSAQQRTRVHAAPGPQGALRFACSSFFADSPCRPPQASLVGSVGVVSSGFGFAGLLEKLGVQRRVYTAGDSKASLDPFLPEKPEDAARRRELLAGVHAGFCRDVLARRDGRLRAGLTAEEACSGQLWSGAEAAANGMVDAVGDLGPVLRQRFGCDVALRVYGTRRSALDVLAPGAGAARAEAAAAALLLPARL